MDRSICTNCGSAPPALSVVLLVPMLALAWEVGVVPAGLEPPAGAWPPAGAVAPGAPGGAGRGMAILIVIPTGAQILMLYLTLSAQRWQCHPRSLFSHICDSSYG